MDKVALIISMIQLTVTALLTGYAIGATVEKHKSR